MDFTGWLWKKIKKIVAQWVPSSVPFGDCEKRTVTRFALSFAFRLISLAQGLPFSTIYAFAFLFFSSPSDWQKIFSSPVKIFLSHFAHFFCHAKNYFKTSKQKLGDWGNPQKLTKGEICDFHFDESVYTLSILAILLSTLFLLPPLCVLLWFFKK